MTAPDIIHLSATQLKILVGSADISHIPDPLPASPWVAMSALQKGIRRGRAGLALQAAATLLRDAPERLWRRLGIIAYEDVGVADLDAVYLTTAALAGQRARARIGTDWAVASYLIERLSTAQKCRAADDLLLVANVHPQYDHIRRELAEWSDHALLAFAAGPAPLPKRAIALWYAVGTGRALPGKFEHRRGEARAAFEALRDLGLPCSAVDVSEFGYRRLGETLCAFFPMLAVARQSQVATTTSDDLPPELMVRGNPSCTLDFFTREGRRAFSTFAAGDSATADWLRRHIPRAKRVEVLGNLVFHVEGGRMIDRCVWSAASELQHLAETGCIGVEPPIALEGLDLMRADIPALNEVRDRG